MVRFHSVIVWHCSNHRLALSVADTVIAVARISRFKVYGQTLCHQSYITEEQPGMC
jgi:hypothetical protein